MKRTKPPAAAVEGDEATANSRLPGAVYARVCLTAALVLRSADHAGVVDVSDATLRQLAAPTMVLLVIVAWPLLVTAFRRHSIESALFFCEVFVILAVVATGAAWLSDRAGWTQDLVYVAGPAVFVLLPVLWLVAVVVVRLSNRDGRAVLHQGIAKNARRVLVLGAVGTGAWLYWLASDALGVQSQAWTAALLIGGAVFAFHLGATMGTNRNTMIWGSKAYTTEGLVADFTGQGVATLGDVRRLLAAWVRAHRAAVAVAAIACVAGYLMMPIATCLGFAIALVIGGWILGERAQDAVDAAQ